MFKKYTMGEQFVHYEDIGEVLFIKNPRARNLRISVNRSRGVRVTVPRSVSYQYAYDFVEQKRDWILRNIEKFTLTAPEKIIFKPGTEFSSRYHYMYFTHLPDSELTVKVKKGAICIYYPSDVILVSEAAQKLIHKGIEFAIRKEAKHYLPLRVEILAGKYGFSYANVRVKNMKTRWGSCSVQNNINLNIHLMRLPEHLSDYVILHELVHTVHKNHGKMFWQALDKITGNARLLAKEMRNYQTQLV